MPALASVWISLASLAIAAAMVVYRPAFTDLAVALALYFGSPGGLCLAGMVLWSHRQEDARAPGIESQRLQAKVAIVLSLFAAAIVYLLIIFSHKIDAIEAANSPIYNPS